MSFKIAMRDEEGNPTYVHTNDGYAQTSRPFDKETDGWMEEQLDTRDFPAVEIGYQMEYLIQEVNELRRENFMLKRRYK